MNYWPLICLAVTVIAAVLGFGAGAATGATFNGLDFKDVFIPMFSALGGWVSGAGALAAVGTTIYFYKKQEEENEEELEVTVYSRYGNVRVDILCLSRHPAFVTDIFLEVENKAFYLSLSGSKELDAHISYKEKRTFDLWLLQKEIERVSDIDLIEHTDKLVVETTFATYTPDVNYITEKA